VFTFLAFTFYFWECGYGSKFLGSSVERVFILTLFASCGSESHLFIDRDYSLGSYVNLYPDLEVFQLSISLITNQFHIMDHRYLQELRMILRTHEDMVQGHNNSIFTLISKFNKYEYQFISQIAEIMSNLL
jgi:hypothetical protein